MPGPKIETGLPCEVNVGATIPLAVTGMPGTDVVYRWTASAGTVDPPNQAAVTYKAPAIPGDVIIRVDTEKDGVASEATLKCKVIGPTPTPTPIQGPTPTSTPSPSPTPWECTSARSTKLQTADIPGTATIDMPAPASIDLPSGSLVPAGGSYTGIPEGKYLWVFIYSRSAGLHGRYYPQTRDAVQAWQPDKTTAQGGRWSLDINFGAPHLCYEIILMAADASASRAIAEQLQKWAAAGDYTGYELGGPFSAEPPDPPGFPDGLVELASIEVKTK
jgi:hypothetical protein